MIKRLWERWYQGFRDQVQHHADADLLVAYRRAIERHGAESLEAKALREAANEIESRRNEG